MLCAMYVTNSSASNRKCLHIVLLKVKLLYFVEIKIIKEPVYKPTMSDFEK